MASGDSMLSGVVRLVPVGCTRLTLTGGGTPAEPFAVHGFADGVASDLLLTAWLSGAYAGGGLTLRLLWRSTATTGAVVWRARPRNLAPPEVPAGAYDYRTGAATVTTTVPATAGATVLSTLTFADGAAMDAIEAGDPFALLLGRSGTAGGDTMTARADLLGVELVET